MLIVPVPIGGATFEPTIQVTPLSLFDGTTLATSYTMLTKYRPGVITKGGNIVRLTVEAPTTGEATLTNTTIGKGAVSGNAWNCSATPTAITWNNGSSSLAMTRGFTYISDEITFEVDDTVSLIIAFNIASGSKIRIGNLGDFCISYQKASVSEAGSASRGSSYVTRPGINFFTTLLEVGL